MFMKAMVVDLTFIIIAFLAIYANYIRKSIFKLKPLLLRRGGRRSRSERFNLLKVSSEIYIKLFWYTPLSWLKLTALLKRRALI